MNFLGGLGTKGIKRRKIFPNKNRYVHRKKYTNPLLCLRPSRAAPRSSTLLAAGSSLRPRPAPPRAPAPPPAPPRIHAQSCTHAPPCIPAEPGRAGNCVQSWQLPAPAPPGRGGRCGWSGWGGKMAALTTVVVAAAATAVAGAVAGAAPGAATGTGVGAAPVPQQVNRGGLEPVWWRAWARGGCRPRRRDGAPRPSPNRCLCSAAPGGAESASLCSGPGSLPAVRFVRLCI